MENEITAREWAFFLRGPTTDVVIPEDDVAPTYVPEKVYSNLYALSNLASVFKDIIQMMKDEST